MPVAPPRKRHPYDQWSPDARALDLVGDKWTLLIIRDLVGGPRRFVELQRVLPGISTEQLRSRLNRMVADDLLTRERFREVPPRVEYGLTERSRELVDVIGALARWGYDWAWSEPKPDERVDIGAVLRAGTGLIEPSPSLRGRVDCVVFEPDDGRRRYALSAGGGRVTVAEEKPGRGDATISGSVDAWVRALGPRGDASQLDFTGDRRLADAVLGGFLDAASGGTERAVA